MNHKKILHRVVLVVMLILPFFIYFTMVYSAEENFFVTLSYAGPKQALPGDTQHIVPYTIPEYEHTTQHDTALSAADMRGKIYLANFFFTSCPNVCPAMNYNVKQLQDRFKGYEDFRIVSFSVDPEHDSPAVLRKYAKELGAQDGLWYFLTGNADSIYATAEDFFVNAMPDSSAPGGFLHSQYVLLIDWEGHIRSRKDEHGNILAVYDGLKPSSINDLEDDIKVLIAEYEREKSIANKDVERIQKVRS